jgi:general nucleoside transport system permease protein
VSVGRPRRALVIAVVVTVVVTVVVLLGISLASDQAGRVLAAFWRGSLGTSSALFSATLVRAIPLTIIGVGIALAFRAGVFNIGGEGQLLLGAVAAAIVGLAWSEPLGGASVPIALLASALAGGAWAGIAALLRARYGVLEVISTIMLNFVAANLVSYLVRGPMQEPSRVYPQTASIPDAAQLPRLWAETRLHAGVLIAVAVGVAAWWILKRTAAGFRISAVGASPAAAEITARVSVVRISSGALVASGALAGLAGGIEVLGVTYALYENISPGFGFSAIAVAILARLNPLAIFGTALLFAVFQTGALGMQRDAGVPSVVASALEATAILLFVGFGGAFASSRWQRLRSSTSAPAA